MFIDQAEIQVSSGKGGDGVVHFRREKYVSMGGPDGGDGGKGGDVVLVVDPNLNNLYRFRQQRIFRADNGKNGSKQKMTGRSGKDVEIRVPPGTVIFDAASGEMVGDLTAKGQRLVVARGGRGGRGNCHFATSRNQVPRLAEKGEPAEERVLRLELRLIADIGIVGVPNAGKSTFLAAVTNAKPKIAAYPFTTLEPNLGVAVLDDEVALVLADIPGLIEGAHQGIGLGHDFLRHIQRTRVLIHLLDGLSSDPFLDLAQINSELALFDPDLALKPQLVVLNKMDLPDVQALWPKLKARLQAKGYRAMAISAVSGENVRQALYRASKLLAEAPPAQPDAELPLYRLKEDPQQFAISREGEFWRVTGSAIERAAAMTYWEYDQSVYRFQKILETLGIDAALRKAGVEQGDMVRIGEYELEWQD